MMIIAHSGIVGTFLEQEAEYKVRVTLLSGGYGSTTAEATLTAYRQPENRIRLTIPIH